MLPSTTSYSSPSEHSSSTPILRETRSYVAFPDLRDVLSKSFDDRDAVNRWGGSTRATGSRCVSHPPQQDWKGFTSTPRLPAREDRPHVSLPSVTRTLPPLQFYRHPSPPLYRAPERPTPALPSPLVTSSSGDSYSQEWPVTPSVDNALYDLKRSYHCPQESPATYDLPPHPQIRFMAPQTGPTYPAPESRRPRGRRSEHPAPPSEGYLEIQCGWIGCGAQVQYEKRAISQHIHAAHNPTNKGRSLGPVVCQWERSSGGICGAIMQPNHLRKHTLDLHTALIIAWCELCGEAQRKDVMSRHKKVCERRKGLASE